MPRLSMVDDLLLTNIASSSALQIGDSHDAQLTSHALAVQKEYPNFQGHEGDLRPYRIFTQEIFRPIGHIPVQVNTQNIVPLIKVDHMRIIAIAASSMIHIGSINSIETESRIKHFRSFSTVPEGYRERPELTIYTN
ncbi:spore germination protein GerPE [Pullulanibacillus sp. KACC 23026]|uniref:spore germination protein GerPE n=1 Tax=Pullulanibacillus sp. KACC 23026 TaxID=3028315 RepID=UPI0023B081D5|nr:spore germination protein GerPE [Pullulanibacillus sp. KACC 23026]WEG12334.1 spore germination protein GerPE [Pullulanibacillus sp. KACC 23026]